MPYIFKHRLSFRDQSKRLAEKKPKRHVRTQQPSKVQDQRLCRHVQDTTTIHSPILKLRACVGNEARNKQTTVKSWSQSPSGEPLLLTEPTMHLTHFAF